MKINALGINSTLLCWLNSYLRNRKQFVQLGNFESEIFNVTSGVPQGSHLGPLLFILFINDLTSVVNHSECLLFADDLKLFRKITSLTDCQLLQLDIDAISNWSIINDLPLNIKKGCSLTFSKLKHKINFNYPNATTLTSWKHSFSSKRKWFKCF